MEAVFRIERAVENGECRFGGIKVADIMLGRVTRAALVEQRPHPMFDAKAIMPRRDDIILVQDVAEEVAVIDFVDQRGVEIGGQRLEPGRVVTAQRDIERRSEEHTSEIPSLMRTSYAG